MTQMTWTALFVDNNGVLKSKVFHGRRDIEEAKDQACEVCGGNIIALITGSQNVFLF